MLSIKIKSIKWTSNCDASNIVLSIGLQGFRLLVFFMSISKSLVLVLSSVQSRLSRVCYINSNNWMTDFQNLCTDIRHSLHVCVYPSLLLSQEIHSSSALTREQILLHKPRSFDNKVKTFIYGVRLSTQYMVYDEHIDKNVIIVLNFIQGDFKGNEVFWM